MVVEAVCRVSYHTTLDLSSLTTLTYLQLTQHRRSQANPSEPPPTDNVGGRTLCLPSARPLLTPLHPRTCVTVQYSTDELQRCTEAITKWTIRRPVYVLRRCVRSKYECTPTRHTRSSGYVFVFIYRISRNTFYSCPVAGNPKSGRPGLFTGKYWLLSFPGTRARATMLLRN